MNAAADIEARVRGYIERVLLPLLPKEVEALSFEIVSWHICVHSYQYSALDDEPFKLFDAKVKALAETLPPREGEPWQSTPSAHRVHSGQGAGAAVEGQLVYVRASEA